MRFQSPGLKGAISFLPPRALTLSHPSMQAAKPQRQASACKCFRPVKDLFGDFRKSMLRLASAVRAIMRHDCLAWSILMANASDGAETG